MRFVNVRAAFPAVTWFVAASAAPHVTQAADVSSQGVGLGFETALGAGAAAWIDNGAAVFENPAALARVGHSEALAAGGSGQPGVDLVRFGLVHPTLSGPVLGFGYTRWRSDAPAPALGDRRQLWHLGVARRWGAGVDGGAVLKLQSHAGSEELDTSYGIDLGLRWSPSGRTPGPARDASTPRISTALVIHNALEPRVRLGTESAREARRLLVAVAYERPLSATWSAVATAGLQTQREEHREASVGALVRWRNAAELALGAQGAHLRVGSRVSYGSWHVGYAVAGLGSGAAHQVAVYVRLGPRVADRRLARERQRLERVAQRVSRVVAERETAQVDRWNEEARAAFTSRDFERATNLFAMVLAWRPDDARALDGMQRSRHAAFVQKADSLLQRRDYASAVRALEQALALLPDDSASTARLHEARLAATDAHLTLSKVTRKFREGIDAYAQQRYLDAVRIFDAVLLLDPDHKTAASYLQRAQDGHRSRVQDALDGARSRLDADDYDGARALVRRVLALEPGHAEARTVLGQIKRREDQARRAESERRRAEERDGAERHEQHVEDAAPEPPPAFVTERYARGMQLYRTGDLIGATKAWEEVAQHAPHYKEVDKYLLRVYRVTGLESYTEGRLREAVEIWEKALEFEPDSHQLHRYLNRAHAKLERAQSGPGGS